MASGLVMVRGMMEKKTLTEGGSGEKQAGQGEGHDGASTGRGDWQGGFFACLGMPEIGLVHQPSVQPPYGSAFN